MQNRMENWRQSLAALFWSGLFGGIIAGLTVGSATLLCLPAFYSPRVIQALGEIAQIALFNAIVAFFGGVIMGWIGALLENLGGWIYAAGIGFWLCYLVLMVLLPSGRGEIMWPFAAFFLAAIIASTLLSPRTEGGLKELHWRIKLAPFARIAAWKRMLWAFVIPVFCCLAIIFSPTVRVFWGNRDALTDFGWKTTWQASAQMADAAKSGNRSNSSCQSNLKQIGLAIRQYNQDFDEKYPLVATGGRYFGWADAIQPYLKSVQVYQCPAEPREPANSPRRSGYTDYWYNAQLAGQSERALFNWSNTFLNGEGDGFALSNARYALLNAPPHWLKNRQSPFHRHYRIDANYAFADGHVKWIKPPSVGKNSPKQGYSWALQ